MLVVVLARVVAVVWRMVVMMGRVVLAVAGRVGRVGGGGRGRGGVPAVPPVPHPAAVALLLLVRLVQPPLRQLQPEYQIFF